MLKTPFSATAIAWLVFTAFLICVCVCWGGSLVFKARCVLGYVIRTSGCVGRRGGMRKEEEMEVEEEEEKEEEEEEEEEEEGNLPDVHSSPSSKARHNAPP